MNLLKENTAAGFFHDKPVLFMGSQYLLPTLLEFTDDTRKDREQDCQGWGAEDLVFPSCDWDTAFNLLSNYAAITNAKRSGHLHISIEEELAGDDVNAITLRGGYLKIEQRIVFYDLPAAQKAA